MIYWAEKTLFCCATNQHNVVGVLWLRTLHAHHKLCVYVDTLTLSNKQRCGSQSSYGKKVGLFIFSFLEYILTIKHGGGVGNHIAVFKWLVGDSEDVINIFLLRQRKLLTKFTVFPAGTWYYD